VLYRAGWEVEEGKMQRGDAEGAEEEEEEGTGGSTRRDEGAKSREESGNVRFGFELRNLKSIIQFFVFLRLFVTSWWSPRRVRGQHGLKTLAMGEEARRATKGVLV
jgi:hypothetical protein